jgi:DNA repair protein RecN (Recombination protein N)
VDIHGQHEHQSLLKQETHRYFLDYFGKLQPVLNQVKEKFSDVKKIQNELLKLEEKQKALTEKLELYLFQKDEIDKSQLQNEEDIQLEEQRKLLANSEKLFEISNRLLQIFNGEENSLIDRIGEANNNLKDLSEFSNDLKNLYNEFNSARIVINETSRSIEEFQNSLEFDPQGLEEIEARLNLINTLKKKYGSTIEQILNYRDQIAKDLDTHENFEFELGNLRKEYQNALDQFKEAALQLSQQRKNIASKMQAIVHEQLELLGMSKTRFQIQIEFLEDENGFVFFNGKKFYADQFGLDHIEFYISTNPGEEFKPLNKIVSGGEISRIMLALKSILADVDRIPTLIFDEIDLGVSGRIAQAVGRSISNLSQLHQILCITHLPQIASQGNSHFTVEKFVQDSRTFTKVTGLTEEGRIEEIARLIGGEKITETVKESARQLIEEAKE